MSLWAECRTCNVRRLTFPFTRRQQPFGLTDQLNTIGVQRDCYEEFYLSYGLDSLSLNFAVTNYLPSNC